MSRGEDYSEVMGHCLLLLRVPERIPGKRRLGSWEGGPGDHWKENQEEDGNSVSFFLVDQLRPVQGPCSFSFH